MSQTSNNKHKDIPQGTTKKDLWDAFESEEVISVFREEFSKRNCLHEFMDYHGLEKTHAKLAEMIEWRAMLRACMESKPEGGVE